MTQLGIVTIASTIICLVLTLIAMFVFFTALMYGVILLVFPHWLMQSWPTIGEAAATLDHIKLSLFLPAMRVLAGSLGGRSTAATWCTACCSSPRRSKAR